ncbi:hypothetical protein [Pseudonocardia endophytica]|uniref:Uncharacterized protein n=1 Tax=Pseudonocardia endophytica TaxID=401976 RepID=A0A4R1HJ70_PSEEN|nr:hypothetical protein [Pseudonocardia endophytica]TCK20290.1 hypothetical protein EV378_4249 [Pseudonocardia endophytica]
MSLWLDVHQWQPLRGNLHPIADVECEPPDPAPDSPAGWHDWAGECLTEVADKDRWQSGRYHFTVQERDDEGRNLNEIAQGYWEWAADQPVQPGKR